MDFIDSVIMTRTSVRRFTGETIPRETLLRITKAGMAAPSAVNIQPWAIVLVSDRATLDELCAALPYAKMLERAAAAFVVCGSPRKGEVELSKHWAVDCAAMTENILLAAHSLGFGAVWTAVHPDEARLKSARSILGIPREVIPLDVVPIGVVDGPMPAPKDKWKPELIHYDRW
jgi:nitroreductase